MSGNFGWTWEVETAVRPEEALLFRAAALRPAPAPVPPGLDADALLRLAGPHGMTPLLFRHLEEAGYGGCPEGLRERLRASMADRTLRAFALVEELTVCLRGFRAAGIPAVPFKGPTLSLGAYGSFGMRESVDLDFLLPKDRVREAAALILARGYAPERDLTPAEEAAQFRVFCDRKYVHRDRPIAVELHWDVVPRFFCFSLDFAAVRERLRCLRLAGEETRVLGPEDLFLVLAVHGAKHCFERFAWLADLARVVATAPAMDWPGLFARARARGAARMVRLALHMAHDWFGAPLPGAVAAAVASDPAVAPLARELRAGLFAGPPGLLRQTHLHLRMRERPRDRVEYALRLALTPTMREWSTRRLPAPLFFLHYLRRPVRLLTLLARGVRGGGCRH
jgi:hypothetical protein